MEKQILLMDGAMGSLIQEYKLTEEEFRGTRKLISIEQIL
jgi:5-methyltetrahydrofolate--homocysteine methyltransferase